MVHLNDILYSPEKSYYFNHPSLSATLINFERPMLDESLRGRIQVTWKYNNLGPYQANPYGIITWCTGTIVSVKGKVVKRQKTRFGTWKRKQVWIATVKFDARPPHEKSMVGTFALDIEKWYLDSYPNRPQQWRLLK
jgi:hypothetical protein